MMFDREELDYEFGENDGVLFVLDHEEKAIPFVDSVSQLRSLDFKGRITVRVTRELYFPIHSSLNVYVCIDERASHKKSTLFDSTPFTGRTVYLDCGMMVKKIRQPDSNPHKDEFFEKLLPPTSNTPEVMFASRPDIKTTSSEFKTRMVRWKSANEINVFAANPYPVVDISAFGFSRRSSEFFHAWSKNVIKYRMDEDVAAQFLLATYPSRLMAPVYSDRLERDKTVILRWRDV